MVNSSAIDTNKPYDICIKCKKIGVRCDGPNFLAMKPQRRCEWIRERIKYLHETDPKWTVAYVAEQAGVSKSTLDKYLSGNTEDIRLSTIALVLQTLIGTWGQYPCAMDAFNKEEDDDTLCAELDRLRYDKAELQDEVKFLKERLGVVSEWMNQRTDFLRRKDHTILFLSFILGLCLFVILSALVVDKLNPNIGFLWVK